MSSPSTPKVINIISRVEKVLAAIAAGDNYFYTVGADNVIRGLRVWTEAKGFPFMMVYLGSDHRPAEYHPDSSVFIYPTVLVACYTDGEDGDTVSKAVKVLRDVRKAINDDMRSVETGTLGTLCEWGVFGNVVTDEGELGLDGLAGFRLELNFCISGDFGDF